MSHLSLDGRVPLRVLVVASLLLADRGFSRKSVSVASDPVFILAAPRWHQFQLKE
jgi:hypothetical protein